MQDNTMADRVHATKQPQLLASRVRLGTPQNIGRSMSMSYPAADQTFDRGVSISYTALHQFPQQYALPVRCTQYDQTPVALYGDGQQKSRNSEHFLRRKTPCETLAAAYDGSSVESSGHHHVMKRLLLPVTNTNGDAEPENRPIMTYLAPQTDLNAGGAHDMDRSYTEVWTRNSIKPTGYVGTPGQVKQGSSSFRSTYQLPPIDFSMNHIPPKFSPNFSQQDARQPPKAMQPPFQMPLVPTVSNDAAGYWRNWASIPYEPAASPDPRYIHNTDGAVNDFNRYTTLHSGPPKSSKRSYPVVDCPPDSASLHQMNFAHERQAAGVGFVPCTYSVQVHSTSSIEDGAPILPSRYPLQPSANNANLSAVQDETSMKINILSFGERQSFRAVKRSSTNVSTSSCRENVSYPDRVLAWARTVYANLLSEVYQARRGDDTWRNPMAKASPRLNIHHQRRQGAAPALHLFHHQYGRCTDSPKPAHNGEYITQKHDLSGIHANYNLQTVSVRSCQSRLKYKHLECYYSSVPRNSACRHPLPFQFTPDLDGTTTAHNKKVDKWHQKCSAPVLPVPSFFAQKSGPRRNAMAAIEALTQLCEMSVSIWIDGSLVAGCLSHLLGEYQQAIRWYSMVLEQDAE